MKTRAQHPSAKGVDRGADKILPSSFGKRFALAIACYLVVIVGGTLILNALGRPASPWIGVALAYAALVPAAATLPSMKNRLPALRVERGWTQAELAKQLGVSRQTVTSLKRDKYDPSLPLAFKIACAFELPIEGKFSVQ